MAEHLSKLELERLERINENKRRMQEIGLGEAAAAIRASQAQHAPSQNGPKRKRVYERIFISEEDLRRSDRRVRRTRTWPQPLPPPLPLSAPLPLPPPLLSKRAPVAAICICRSRKDVNYNEQQFYKQADAALRGPPRQR